MLDFSNLNFDMDGDGVLDSFAQEVDLDGDGFVDGLLVDMGGEGTADMLVMDLDGDGIPESAFVDTDTNGVFDTLQMNLDTDGDGYVDQSGKYNDFDQDGNFESANVYTDTDGDGRFDLVNKSFDTDHDGSMDDVTTIVDLDGDGAADLNFQEFYADTDGDALPDTYVLQADMDGDGVFDAVEVYEFTADGLVELAFQEEIASVGGGVGANFEPAAADPESIVGDPGASMEEWEFQGNTNRCALYSQKFVIEEITGQDVDIEQMADIAEDNRFFSEEGGTPLLHMNKMLDFYGVENEMSFHNSADDLRNCLENGGKVIVSVDADEIWFGETDDLFTPVDGANHAVQVIGIDETDPENPMVILNDSGTPDGCGELVPMDVFLNAWDDGGCQMISCF